MYYYIRGNKTKLVEIGLSHESKFVFTFVECPEFWEKYARNFGANLRAATNLHESNSGNYFRSGIDFRGIFRGLEQFQPPGTFVESTT